jgi:RNA polymerase sigma factor (sigma-70 family)
MKAKTGDKKAQDELINSNLLFIFSVCQKYAKGNDVLDLIGVATIGVINAIRCYDINQGVSFLSYAVRAMQDEILQVINNNTLIVNKAEYKLRPKMLKLRDAFFQSAERYPTEGEMVALLEAEGMDSNEYQVMPMSFTSFSDVVGDDDATIEECGQIAVATATTNDGETTIQSSDNKIQIERLLDKLPPIERRIIEGLFGINGPEEPIDEIAEKLGFTTERVRQLKANAIAKMHVMAKRAKLVI